MQQRVSLVTLGVQDLGRARAFYEALGWSGAHQPDDEVCFFQAGGMVFGLWTALGGHGAPGIELAHIVGLVCGSRCRAGRRRASGCHHRALGGSCQLGRHNRSLRGPRGLCMGSCPQPRLDTPPRRHDSDLAQIAQENEAPGGTAHHAVAASLETSIFADGIAAASIRITMEAPAIVGARRRLLASRRAHRWRGSRRVTAAVRDDRLSLTRSSTSPSATVTLPGLIRHTQRSGRRDVPSSHFSRHGCGVAARLAAG